MLPTDGTRAPYPTGMDALALRADRTATNRTFGLVVGSMLLVVLMCVVLAVYFLSQGAGYAVVPFVVPVAVLGAIVLVQLRAWSATRRITHPVELTLQGLSVDTPEGRLALGWEAVASVAVSGTSQAPTLGVRLHPQVGPGTPGVVSSLTPRSWRILRRRGLQLAVPLTDITAEELAAAVRHFSSGRWCPAPVG